jgi:hypothetical protein
MILGRGFTDLVSPLGRELQMVGLLGMSEKYAIEAFMVVKLGEDGEAKPCGIYLGNGCSMVSRSGNAEHSTSFHYLASFGVAPDSGAAGTTPSCCIRLQVSKRMRVALTFRSTNRSMTIPQTCIARLVAGIPKNSP